MISNFKAIIIVFEKQFDELQVRRQCTLIKFVLKVINTKINTILI